VQIVVDAIREFMAQHSDQLNKPESVAGYVTY
jgi:hypothetical protein